MFERFTTDAREVVVAAHDLARELGSPQIGTGHLLYGCAEQGDLATARPLRDYGVTPALIRRLLPGTGEGAPGEIDADSLRAIGIDYDVVQAAVAETFGPGALESAPDRRRPAGRRPRLRFSPAARESLRLAHGIAARELHHSALMPGHLLLGLLRLDDEFVLGVLDQAGTTVGELSAAVLTELSPPRQRPA